MKGIFLGAGASYEVGMPLVWEFTNTLRKNVLKRLDSKLFNFDQQPSFKHRFIDLLSKEDSHYEEVVGELEKIYLAERTLSQLAHGTLMQLIECISSTSVVVLYPSDPQFRSSARPLPT